MFGHERGAFTGAVASRPGRFKLADHGTIFLDEIGEMSPKLQVKLLRVLEDGRFEPVGSVGTQQVDVRIIAATNRTLDEAVAAKQFREDLFYRLCVVPIEMPPLRRRREDIPLLVRGVLGQLAAKGLPRFDVAPAALEVLARHSWPGNVRELRNLLEQMVVLGRPEHVIEVHDLPPHVVAAQASRATLRMASAPRVWVVLVLRLASARPGLAALVGGGVDAVVLDVSGADVEGGLGLQGARVNLAVVNEPEISDWELPRLVRARD